MDLEQREGRVHRYKGHAIRKNIASAHRAAAFRRSVSDPWEAMFEAARKARAKGVTDLVPYWVYMTEGGARIERYVPAFPLSQEVERLERLKKSLAVYRMALGWPRQEDAADFVARIAEGGDLRELMNRLMLDLSPRR